MSTDLQALRAQFATHGFRGQTYQYDRLTLRKDDDFQEDDSIYLPQFGPAIFSIADAKPVNNKRLKTETYSASSLFADLALKQKQDATKTLNIPSAADEGTSLIQARPGFLLTGADRNFQILNAPQVVFDPGANHGNGLMSLSTEVHFVIFDICISDREMNITDYMYVDNVLRKLRRVSRKMYGVVREYQQRAMRDTAKFRFLISPDFGLFDPYTTTFALSLDPCDEGNQYLYEVNLSLAKSSLIKFAGPSIHHGGILHLKFSVQKSKQLDELLEYVRDFRKLQTFEVILGPGKAASDGDHLPGRALYNALLAQGINAQLAANAVARHAATENSDEDSAHDKFWSAFWSKGGFCHPGKCCTCCALPELKFRYAGQGGEEAGSTTAAAAVMPFKHLLLENGCDRYYQAGQML
ncbi:hypothetical protein B0O99DRAFT_689610 [Bisporella sp. PMI_857]|nr:hypothetical protein B0O99DRAFT_689610 [Bisporella sp. PMI_857]